MHHWLKSDFDYVNTRKKNKLFAQALKSLVNVEHNKDWFEMIKPLLHFNTELIFQELDYGGNYCNIRCETKKKYNDIIIDGRNRVSCITNSVNHIKENGLVVLDDSERDNYKPGIDFLEQNELRRIDFWGIAPTIFHNRCTSVFYKNVLK